VGGKEYAVAANYFGRLLTPPQNFAGYSDKWEDFINAAASSPDISQDYYGLPVRIANEWLKPGYKLDPVMGSRMAWVLMNFNKDYKLAQDVLNKGLQIDPSKPDYMTVRIDPKLIQTIRSRTVPGNLEVGVEHSREISGVLAKAERFEQAASMLDGLKMTEELHEKLGELYAGYRNWPKAEMHTREAIRLAPTEAPAYLMRDETLLADITSWKEDHLTAMQMFRDLTAKYPNEEYFPRRYAEAILWSKDYDRALSEFVKLYRKDPTRVEVWEGFARSVAKARALTNEHQVIANEILAKLRILNSKNAVTWATLGWAMYRFADGSLVGDELIDKAISLKPSEPPQRRDLAGILYELRRFKDALPLFDNVRLTREDKYKLIDILTIEELRTRDNLVRAVDLAKGLRDEDQTTKLTDLTVNDRRSRAIYGYVLTLVAREREADEIFQALLAEKRSGDRKDHLQIADVLLRAKAYNYSLNEFDDLIRSTPKGARPEEESDLWLKFLDSAASATNFRPETHGKTALYIHDRLMASELQDAARFSRLAWVLGRLDQKEKANYWISRARDLKPQEPDIRREIAGVLAFLKRYPEALDLYKSLPDKLRDPLDFGKLLVAAQYYDDGIVVLKGIRGKRVTDRENREVEKQLGLALIYSATRNREKNLINTAQVREGRAILEKLYIDDKTDKELLMSIGYAELASREYVAAMTRFAELIERDRENRDYWLGFLDATSSQLYEVKGYRMTDAQWNTIIRIYNSCRNLVPAEDRDGRMVTVLASILAKETSPEYRQAARFMFQKGIRYDRGNLDTWLRYAQTLSDIGDDLEAKRVYDLLLQRGYDLTGKAATAPTSTRPQR
jgi:tetratricopeptide (TPR) repeat protein